MLVEREYKNICRPGKANYRCVICYVRFIFVRFGPYHDPCWESDSLWCAASLGGLLGSDMKRWLNSNWKTVKWKSMEGKTRKKRQRKERQWNNRRTRTDKEWKDNERQGNGREDNERKDNERKDNERFGGAGTPSQRFSALPLGGRMVRSPAKGFLISNFFWKQTLVFEEFLEIGHQGMTRHGRKFSYFPWEIKIKFVEVHLPCQDWPVRSFWGTKTASPWPCTEPATRTAMRHHSKAQA